MPRASGPCPVCAEEKAFLRALVMRLDERLSTLTAQVVTLSDPLAEARRAQAKVQESRVPGDRPEWVEPRRAAPPPHSPGLLRRTRADVMPAAPATAVTPEQIEASFEE